MEQQDNNIDLLFETSWEVCNKVGGIYTVLSTKAKTLHDLYKDRLIFVGPDVWSDSNPCPVFTPVPSLLKAWRKAAQLPYGIEVRVGRWEVPGRPVAVLVKFDSLYAHKNEFYGRMWDLYQVDSLHAYGDYDEACAFALASAMVMESIARFNAPAGNIVAQFNEWTTGMGLLYIKDHLPEVATVFTTHATSIGRSICGNGKPLYDYLPGYNGDQMAGELNMQSKHSLEKAAAHQADCFTTVSDVTARECEQLLDRRPDVVTPNGFEMNFVPGKRQFAASRRAARSRMLEVASALTGEKYDDDTFIIATSGRCEYRNKGLDVMLDALNHLRNDIAGESRKVIAFIMVPAWVKAPRADIATAVAEGKHDRLNDCVITHELNNPEYDAVLSRIHQLGFNNGGNLTVIDVPCYLNGTDGIFNMSYYDLLIGMDATVFPSYYEPWGYTPLESVAFGVPTVTTSLSGFGQWVMSTSEPTFEISGVNVIGRTDSNYDAVVDTIARSLRFLIDDKAAELAEISEAARATAARASWSNFIAFYLEAFAIAIKNEKARN
ncbi:MAG: glycogen/starch synthase [Paramuribaculum sp.]|nr:glycogen/starch synthase [Paramuribaculum sp.]